MNKMLNPEAALFAALDAKAFLRRHGNGLTELLDAIAGDHGVDIYCAADRMLDRLDPDPARVGQAIRELRDLLEGAGVQEDKFEASLRWHGARLTELSARLPG